MKSKSVLTLFICLIALQLGTKFAQASQISEGLCPGLFSQIKATDVHLSAKHIRIETTESLDTAISALNTINSLIEIANQESSHRAQIYKEAMPELLQVRDMGDAIVKNKASDQNQTFEFFHQFVTLVDLARDFGDLVGRYADGFGYMRGFSESEYEKRLSAFKDRYAAEPIKDVLRPLIQREWKKVENKDLSLTSGFTYINLAPNTQLPDNLRFPFQYQYIFKVGLLSLVDLFKDRENGKTYIGVSLNDVADYDGQYGDAKSFLRHDLLHTYTQKYYDLLLFQEFKATKIRQMKLLKMKTNALLQKRIQEYQEIQDPELRDAIEVWFFIFLHEQSRTYPIAVESDFHIPEHVQFFNDSFLPSLKENRFGEKYKYLKNKKAKIKAALEWLRIRATEDAKTLRETN